MANRLHKILRFMRDEDGVTAIEYALLASLIAVFIVGAVGTLGVSVNGLFTRVAAGFP